MWNHRSRRAVSIVILALSIAPCDALGKESADPPAGLEAPAAGEDEALYRCKSRSAEVAINFKPELDVKELMAWVVGFTCKNFILDPRIVTTGKKVTVIAPNKMSAPEAYRVFLVALSTIGLTVVPKGNVVRIVDAGAARRDTVPIYRKGLPPDGDQVVRYLLRPAYAGPETLVQAFATMKSDIGEVQQIGTMILMTDYAGNVRDMMSLARLVDVSTGSDGIYTIVVQHADATKLSEKIGGILGIGAATPAAAATAGKPATTSAAVPSKVMVDERTNTLIVASSEAGYLRFKALVERLDVALDIEGGSSIHVYRLGSAIADELAKTLNDALGQGTTRTQPAKGTGPLPAPSVAEGLGTAIEGQVRVISDAPTNSLIVMSTGRDFLAIKEVIAQLDQPRRQVYIEAVILEVTMSDGLSAGTSSHGGIPWGDTGLAIGGVQAPELKSLNPLTLTGAGGLIGGLISSSTKTIVGKSIPSYGILFQALADSSHTNVLSAPSLIALDNSEAKSKIGTNIGFVRGLSFGGLTGDSPTGSVNQNIERIDLLLELNIKPHISIDDTILLEIKHDSKESGGEDRFGPIWNTRSIETRVLVRDQQTVVIGGLMQEREISKATKVPLLGDIPLIGYLFKYSTKSKRKSNMLVMLTPYIVKDQMDLQSLHARKLRDHDEFVRSFKTLDGMKYQPKIDYGRKRGLVEEINRAVLGVDEDAAARAALRPRSEIPGGVIEIPAGVDDR
ncbi:MAG: type II secretion system secretin GspD [Deltaproteobacteria bacterium]|nr:type II secretion system secretin GspD [Deltaproteobacteria bacterium]MDQ3297825.1 type II secretion system secretin GspD [Myxococcota bacterium]